MIKPLVEDLDLLVYQGDCLDVLREMDEDSADASVTSPPYLDARPEYPSPTSYQFEMIFTELRRVVSGPLLLNVGRLWRDRKELLWWTELLDSAKSAGWPLRDTLIWCLGGTTRVYARMKKGEAPILLKDLVRCCRPEDVQLWNGERWTQVLGWSESQSGSGLELTFRSGEIVSCTADHQWPTSRGLLRAGELLVGDVVKTCVLPEPSQPINPDHLPDEIGWFIGLYIAEGSRGGRGGRCIQFSSHVDELERFRRLQRVAASYGGTCSRHETRGKAATINLQGPALEGVLDQYVAGRTAYDKHLHRRSWRRGDEFFRQVLNGYLSGDGHYDEQNDRWRLGFCRNDRLAEDLRAICARLGHSFRLKKGFVPYGDQKKPVYKGQIRFTQSAHGNSKADSEIVGIRRSRTRRFYDVAVADDPHLFALASGLLTHNCKPNANPLQGEILTSAHEYVFLLGDEFNVDEIRTPYAEESLARYGRKFDANAGVKNSPRPNSRDARVGTENELGARPRSYVEVYTGREKGNPHPAPMPIELAVHLVKLAAPAGGTVIDPFGGSGNTAAAARSQGRKSILIELSPEYAALAASRLAQQSLLA